MKNTNKLILTQADYERLTAITSVEDSEAAELLEDELNRASVVPDEKLPKDVVSMNSRVLFQDLETGKETTVTLVYPHEAKIEENKISVLAPVGSALIGLRVGQVIRWPVPSGKEKRLKVVSVLSQGESA